MRAREEGHHQVQVHREGVHARNLLIFLCPHHLRVRKKLIRVVKAKGDIRNAINALLSNSYLFFSKKQETLLETEGKQEESR
jgi:hypothetical protein